MLGLVLNTHQQWMCRQLADLGYRVTRQVAVADSAGYIQQAVREALTRADLILVTGGLGPTSDDLTRELIAELLGKKLQLDPTIQAHIESLFAARRRPLPARAHLQAMVPDGASVLPNPNGTAPGLAMEVRPDASRGSGRAAWLILLPGPPRELRPMFRDHVIPLIQKQFPLTTAVVCRTLKTTGIGESIVEEKISERLKTLTDGGLELGYCARTGEVDVRLIARGVDAPGIVDRAEQIIRDQLGSAIFGWNDDQLEAVVVRLLTERRQTLSVAESCTGGHLADRLTDVPGASAVFLSGLVTYSNEAKQRLLGVRTETLAAQGAVSEATVREMAEGARRRNQTDFALATTGIAGPTGGSPQKPVGTVFIALAASDGTLARQHLNAYDRETFKFVTSQQALELLRQRLIAQP